MKTKLRRLLALVMAAAMAMSLLGASAWAEYPSLSERIAAAEEGDPVVISSSEEVSETIHITKDVSLKFENNAVITGNATRAFQVEDGGALFLDAQGTVTVKGNIDPDSSVIRVGNGSENVESSLHIGKGVTVMSPASYAVTVFGSGKGQELYVEGTVETTGEGNLARPAISGNGNKR